jgi:hypothetical protein
LKINQRDELALAKRIGLFASTDDDARADWRILADFQGVIQGEPATIRKQHSHSDSCSIACIGREILAGVNSAAY